MPFFFSLFTQSLYTHIHIVNSFKLNQITNTIFNSELLKEKKKKKTNDRKIVKLYWILSDLLSSRLWVKCLPKYERKLSKQYQKEIIPLEMIDFLCLSISVRIPIDHSTFRVIDKGMTPSYNAKKYI